MKFHKWGIEIFDGRLKQYGGHWQRLSSFFQLDYLIIDINDSLIKDLSEELVLKNRTFFKRYSMYYDGYHHSNNLIFFLISWGGKPYEETPINEQ